MVKIDFKVTAWERIIVDDADLPRVLEKLKTGEINNSNELYDFLGGESCMYDGLIDDTTEQMSVIDNDNQSTIEVIDDDGQTIFTNVW